MAKKSELEADYGRCGDLSRRAALAGKAGNHRSALALAVEALPHLAGALNHQRRHLKPERLALPPADLILKYAPPLFARKPLDSLGAWVAGLGRAERAAVSDLPARIADARERHAAAVHAWQQFPARPAPSAAVLKLWVAAGLVEPKPGGGYRRVTDLSRPFAGRCPGCGWGRLAPLRELLAPMVCLGCGRSQAFAIIRRMEGS